MPQSLVLELQNLASSPVSDTCLLLRKAMLVARKLDLDDFCKWIDDELTGYTNKIVPAYRKIRGTLHVRNPYYGLQPFLVPDEELADILQIVDVLDPVGKLLHLLSSSNDLLQNPLPDSVVATLMRRQGRRYGALPPIRLICRSEIQSILDRVQTIVLDWSINLEKEGILGEGMVFSVEEKNKAERSTTINIQTFSGIMGDVSGSNQIHQTVSNGPTKGDLIALFRELQSLGVTEFELQELKDALSNDPKPNSKDRFGPKTSEWIGKIIAKAGSGGLAVGVGAAGDLLSKLIQMYYGIDR